MTKGIIFYTGKEQIGKSYMSMWCFSKMQQYELTPEILDEVFRYGRVKEVMRERYVAKYKIAYTYDDQVIYVIYTVDPAKTGIWRGNLNEVWHVLITCWVQRPVEGGIFIL
jgi:hypothetical protein